MFNHTTLCSTKVSEVAALFVSPFCACDVLHVWVLNARTWSSSCTGNTSCWCEMTQRESCDQSLIEQVPLCQNVATHSGFRDKQSTGGISWTSKILKMCDSVLLRTLLHLRSNISLAKNGLIGTMATELKRHSQPPAACLFRTAAKSV